MFGLNFGSIDVPDSRYLRLEKSLQSCCTTHWVCIFNNESCWTLAPQYWPRSNDANSIDHKIGYRNRLAVSHVVRFIAGASPKSGHIARPCNVCRSRSTVKRR
jgi:hypothetical protein